MSPKILNVAFVQQLKCIAQAGSKTHDLRATFSNGPAASLRQSRSTPVAKIHAFQAHSVKIRRTVHGLIARQNSTHKNVRFQSHNASHAAGPSAPKNFWTTPKVLALSMFLTGGSLLAFGGSDNRITASLSSSSAFGLFSSSRFGRPKKPIYASVSELRKAIEELRSTLGEDSISTDDDDLHSHGFSEWSSINVETLPVAVAYPRNTQDVAIIAQTCTKYRIPMIPYSGGTSLEAGWSAPYGGISVDFGAMDQILKLNSEDMDVIVQPSIGWMKLNDQIKDSGLFFPMDPGPSAQIGGMVGTSCSGTNAVRYGTMKDWVMNLTVVLSDGTVIKTRQRARKSSAGYNLTNLFIGSEGTLGFVTEITLKLAVIPEETSVAVVDFPSMRAAASTARAVLRKGIPIAAMEALDDVQMNVVNKTGGTGRTWKEAPTLFFKFSGTRSCVQEHIALVKEIARQHKGGKFEFAKDRKQQEQLWSARKEALYSMMSLKREEDDVWSTDVAVPISRLPDLIEETKEDLDKLGLFAAALGHVGDGNFHTSIMYNRKDPVEREKVEKFVHNMVDRAIEMDGTCTGEHGVGIGKKDHLIHELGQDAIMLMKTLKNSVDPYWIMNPGKIFDVPS